MINNLYKSCLSLHKFHKLHKYIHQKSSLHIPTYVDTFPISAVYTFMNLVINRKNCTIPENSIDCWKCGMKKQSTEELFCAKCKTIQNPHNYKNCFSVMGLKQDYNLDQKDLMQKYRQMQTLLHPDKYTNKTNEEQKISEEYSALVNHAFKTLQSPLNRAIHMLALNGEIITEIDTIDDKKFLMEIMDISEDVEECQTFQQLKKQEDKNNVVLERLILEIGDLLKKGDTKAAKNSTLRMQYYHNIGQQITAYLREMGHVDD